MSFSQFLYQPTSLYHARAPIQCTVSLALTIDHLQDSLWCWWDISCHGLELVFTVSEVFISYGSNIYCWEIEAWYHKMAWTWPLCICSLGAPDVGTYDVFPRHSCHGLSHSQVNYDRLSKNTTIAMSSSVQLIDPIWTALGSDRAKALPGILSILWYRQHWKISWDRQENVVDVVHGRRRRYHWDLCYTL